MKRSRIECYSVQSTPKNPMSQTTNSILSSLRVASAAIALSLTVVLPSQAATLVYSGDTTGKPTFNRPETPGFEGTTNNPPTALSSTGTAVPYSSQPFFVDNSGPYDITGTQNFDAVQFLYQNSFNPTSPLTNLINANDPFPDVNNSSLYGLSLNASNEYILVTSGFSNSDFGTFTNTISPTQTPTQAVPEPSSVLGTVAFGVLGGGLMLRKLKKLDSVSL